MFIEISSVFGVVDPEFLGISDTGTLCKKSMTKSTIFKVKTCLLMHCAFDTNYPAHRYILHLLKKNYANYPGHRYILHLLKKIT
jgi:hypothetical protein